MNKAIIFDLDDTLYAEVNYVKSGFKEVSLFLEKKYKIDSCYTYNFMLSTLEKTGRDKIFDKVLVTNNIYSPDLLNTLVYVYRNHIPDISIEPLVKNILDKLKSKLYRMGIITDGVTVTQMRKIEALGLNLLFDCIVYSDVLGHNNWKPSKVPFEVALNLLNSKPKNTLYIGDNPAKDFKGANEVGIKTVWLKRDESVKFDFSTISEQPCFVIHSLEEIFKIL